MIFHSAVHHARKTDSCPFVELNARLDMAASDLIKVAQEGPVPVSRLFQLCRRWGLDPDGDYKIVLMRAFATGQLKPQWVRREDRCTTTDPAAMFADVKHLDGMKVGDWATIDEFYRVQFVFQRRLVLQPLGSNFCGAACVAMVTGQTIHQAHRWIGKRGLTGAKHLRKALAQGGYRMGDWRHDQPVDTLCIARVRWPEGKTHWVVVEEDGTILDPAHGRNPTWDEGSRITSFYTVVPHDEATIPSTAA